MEAIVDESHLLATVRAWRAIKLTDTDHRLKVLFICTHNSARSQMAEGILNSLYGDLFEAFSAGNEPTSVNPLAITALSEIGIDISHSRSKHVNEFLGKEIDYVVTLCNDVKENCPFFPGAKEYIHHGFDDPADGSFSGLALAAFRRVRDELRDWIAAEFSDKRATSSHQLSFELKGTP